MLDGKIDGVYTKPLEAKVETDIYILDSGCLPLIKDFVGDKIGYHGMAVALTLNITLPEKKTHVKCIKTLPASGSGNITAFILGLKYILTIPKTKRTIINISASVSSNKFTRINSLIKKMARKGFIFVIASGNMGMASPLGSNACLYSLTNLARLKNVHVVGAPELWSRNGKCVEYQYPGSFRTVHPLSGTSFSAPVFTGILAQQ